ncbi:hypothetical protein BDK51DRAFT_47541 [Blyttiomyces helicus]|uniref:Uncharacterized protein n=1 Tax=Blyttiomyces helicus TaxID=388810 RepID=A0A4P9W525_9FUNG|nr:hypothetical protein BDK51DRAFT_47541 [Blyttiomyces helicus]|eukprot:RKO85840.1 hypothetical protein BDK51DRAFT_47541 [Blyttiomyces helicus]
MRRTNQIWDYIERVDQQERSTRRAALAEHVAKQREAMTHMRTGRDVRGARDLEDERRRKQFLVDRRLRLYAVAGGETARVPMPLEFLHPGNPHFRPGVKDAPPGAAGVKTRAPVVTKETRASSPAPTVEPQGSTTAGVPVAAGLTMMRAPSMMSRMGISSSMMSVQPAASESMLTERRYQESVLALAAAAAPSTTSPRLSTRDESLRAVFRGRHYHSQAHEHRFVRREMLAMTAPRRYAPDLSLPRLPDLSDALPKVDDFIGGVVTRGDGIPGLRRGKRMAPAMPARSGSGRDKDPQASAAIVAVFENEEKFRLFKAKYRAAVSSDSNEPLETIEQIKRRSRRLLVRKQQMLTTAARNRQRTVAIAGKATSSPNVFLLGLEAFAPKLLHPITDAPVPDTPEALSAPETPNAESPAPKPAEPEEVDVAHQRVLSSRQSTLSVERSGDTPVAVVREDAAPRRTVLFPVETVGRPASVPATLYRSNIPTLAFGPRAGTAPAEADAAKRRRGSTAGAASGWRRVRDAAVARDDARRAVVEAELERRAVSDRADRARAEERIATGRRGPSAKSSDATTTTAMPAADAEPHAPVSRPRTGGAEPAFLKLLKTLKEKKNLDGTLPGTGADELEGRESTLTTGLRPPSSTLRRPSLAPSSRRVSTVSVGEASFASSDDLSINTPRQADSTCQLKPRRVVRNWEPISLVAAAETRRTVNPSDARELPLSLVSEGVQGCRNGVLGLGVEFGKVDGIPIHDVDQAAAAVPKAIRYWSSEVSPVRLARPGPPPTPSVV